MDLFTRYSNHEEFPYIVSIQDRYLPNHSQGVGVLIHAQLVLSVCSIFKKSVDSNIGAEELRFKQFRVMASDVYLITNLLSPSLLINPQVRFIENVILHPKCQTFEFSPRDDEKTVWNNDLAIVRLTFEFHMDSEVPKLGLLQFKHVDELSWKELSMKRLHELEEYNRKSAICIVVGWGRSIFYRDPVSKNKTKYRTSGLLLVSQVRLSSREKCQEYCDDYSTLCISNETTNASLFCATRTTRQFVGKHDYSHFPGPGTEGSPLICYSADNKSDVYGILNKQPESTCVKKRPLTVTSIDSVSEFVISIIGQAPKIGGSSLQLFALIARFFIINHVWW